MSVVAFAALKGGAGKSTICTLTGSELAMMGLQTTILCADPQHSSWQWAERSKQAGRLPSQLDVIKVDTEGALKEELDKAADRDFVLIDVQGALSQSLVVSLVSSDLAVVPSRGSYMDVVEAIKLFGFAKQLSSACPLRLVFNDVKGIDANTTAFQDALRLVRGEGVGCFNTIIHSRPIFAQFSKDAGALSSLITDASKDAQVQKAKRNIANFINEVFQLTDANYGG